MTFLGYALMFVLWLPFLAWAVIKTHDRLSDRRAYRRQRARARAYLERQR